MNYDQWLEESTKQLAKKLQVAPQPKCETCLDTGQHMDIRCYGGKPVEVQVHCIDCGGELAGEIID